MIILEIQNLVRYLLSNRTLFNITSVLTKGFNCTSGHGLYMTTGSIYEGLDRNS
jgi:hypothetical protein